MTKGLYMGTMIVVFTFVVAITIILTKKRNRKKLSDIIKGLEKEKNMLINVPVLTELSKVKALISNKYLQEKYDSWKIKLDIIEKDTIPEINDMLIYSTGR